MPTPTNSRRTSQRPTRAQSVQSIPSVSSFTTPRPTPPPPPTRLGRGVRANSVVSEVTSPSAAGTTTENSAQKTVFKLPAHYLLPPTYPSPFTGTLEASLDAIQEWGRVNILGNDGTESKGLQPIVDTLLRPVDSRTNWPALLQSLRDNPPGQMRYLFEELFFLVTRTLLPEQIVENRALMARLYNARKQLAMRLLLRYDMLREWKMEAGTHHRDQAVTVASVPPLQTKGHVTPAPSPINPREDDKNKGNKKKKKEEKKEKNKTPSRRPLLPNIIPTLIAAPHGGFTTHGVRERMKHHVTDLDAYLVLSDEEVARLTLTMNQVTWSKGTLLSTLCQVILHWQWLRRNNEVLDEMEVGGWEELEGKADECEWIAEDVRRNVAGGGRKRGRERAVVGEDEE